MKKNLIAILFLTSTLSVSSFCSDNEVVELLKETMKVTVDAVSDVTGEVADTVENVAEATQEVITEDVIPAVKESVTSVKDTILAFVKEGSSVVKSASEKALVEIKNVDEKTWKIVGATAVVGVIFYNLYRNGAFGSAYKKDKK